MQVLHTVVIVVIKETQVGLGVKSVVLRMHMGSTCDEQQTKVRHRPQGGQSTHEHTATVSWV